MRKHNRQAGFTEKPGEFRGTCPHCGAMAFFWNVDKKVGHCKKGGHHKCTDMAPQFEPPFELDSSKYAGYVQAIDVVRLAELSLINKSIVVVHKDVPESAPAYEYLKGRNVTDGDISLSELRFNTATGDLLFPIEPVNDIYPDAYIRRRIQPTIGPYISDSIPKKVGGYLFGKHSLYNKQTGIVLVEGVCDILSPHLLGYGVALMGTVMFLAHAIWLKNNYKRVAIWLDPDAKTAALTIQQKLINDFGYDEKDVWVVDHPGHDPGDCRCLPHISKVIQFCKGVIQ